MTSERHQKLPSGRQDRETLRGKGQFWTPDWVAKPMVEYVMGADPGLVFDPATGNGAFLDALNSLGYLDKGIRFYGLDIDSSLLDMISA